MNKTKRIEIRMTEEDKRIIQDKADNHRLSLSSYCRTILTKKEND